MRVGRIRSFFQVCITLRRLFLALLLVGTLAACDSADDTDPDPVGEARSHCDPLATINHGVPSDADNAKHAGDFGNATASSSGRTKTTVTTEDVSLNVTRPVVGRAARVHSGRDDLRSDPGGMSGTRVGCGIVTSTGTDN